MVFGKWMIEISLTYYFRIVKDLAGYEIDLVHSLVTQLSTLIKQMECNVILQR